MECRNEIYMHCYLCINLVNIPEPVQYHIYAMVFSFDLRYESVTQQIMFL